MSRTAIFWLYFKDSKYVRHQNQIFLLMMIMRCSRLGVKLGLILKPTDTKNILAINSSPCFCLQKLSQFQYNFRSYHHCCASFKKPGCGDDLVIFLTSHTRSFFSGGHLWMFIRNLTIQISSISQSLLEPTFCYRKLLP